MSIPPFFSRRLLLLGILAGVTVLIFLVRPDSPAPSPGDGRARIVSSSEPASIPAPSRDAPDLTERILAARADLSGGATPVQLNAFRELQRRLAAPSRDTIEDPAPYGFHRDASGNPIAENPAQDFEVRFGPGEGDLLIRPSASEDAWQFRMQAAGLEPAQPPVTDGFRVSQRRGAVTEWYLNEPRGLEQFFTLAEPSRIDASGESRIAVRMGTGLSPVQTGRDHLEFRDEDGETVLHYHGLHVVDASGETLDSRMEIAGQTVDAVTVALIFDARDAAYPVTVDPFVSRVLHRFGSNQNSQPREFTPFDGSTFIFSADEEPSDQELWISDGTAAGTRLIKDIRPGDSGSSPRNFTLLDGEMIFVANDGIHGNELWKTDGTAAGTELIKDVHPSQGGVDRNPAFVRAGNLVYFVANDGVNGHELWKTDGTEAGTMMVENINPGANDSWPVELTELNGGIVFVADNGTDGPELWKSDGTEAGTMEVKDINPSGGANIVEFTPFKDALYFQADDGTNAAELWKTDGTEGGTVMVADIHPVGHSFPRDFEVSNGSLFFKATNGTSGSELWMSDGTGPGTTLVKEIRAGNSGSNPSHLTDVNGTLFFVANDGATGDELWKSDGTDDGTQLVADIVAGPGRPFLQNLFAMSDHLLFQADDGVHGNELWKSDGTSAGTVLLKDIFPGIDDDGDSNESSPSRFVEINGTIYFTARDLEGREIWTTDGTPGGTLQFADLDSSGVGVSQPVVSGDRIYFSFDDGIHGRELWTSDGTPSGTGMTRDILPGPDGSRPSELTDLNGTLIFRADDDSLGEELWRSDGSEAGTVLVRDIRPGGDSAGPYEFAPLNGMLYFVANDGTSGVELWKTDGTEAGTMLAADILPGPGHSFPGNLIAFDGSLFFSADGDPSEGRELWKSDGTGPGTLRLVDIHSGADSSSPSELTAVPDLGLFFFSAENGKFGNELWKSDGTAGGTRMVLDIRTGTDSSYPYGFVPFAGKIVFNASDGAHGFELWISDGTPGGTGMIKDIRPGATGSGATQMTAVDDLLYFRADDGATGRELWVTDGTEVRTRLMDLLPGAPDSRPDSLIAHDGTLFFRAYREADGTELLGADGTTVTIEEDIIPGLGSSHPRYPVELNGQLLFFAGDGLGGHTLRAEEGSRPDGQIGRRPSRLKGNNVYNRSGAGQKQRQVSKRLRKVRFRGALENDGDFIDQVRVAGTRRNRFFRAKYFGPGGNITALVFTGRFQFVLTPGADISFRLDVKPTRKLKKGKRIRKKRRSFSVVIASVIAPGRMDRVKALVKTK